jgi:hypothetical protein
LIVSRGRLVEIYKKESNAKVKERLLLIVRIVGDGELPAHVVKPWLLTGLNDIVRKALKDWETNQREEEYHRFL